MKSLTFPLTDEDIADLKVGDNLLLNGTIMTGRDAAHSWLTDSFREEVAPYLKGGAIYHCGPVVAENDGKYEFVAAGPTTSIREEPYQHKVIKDYGLKAVIGKGGMREKTLNALKEYSAVYLHAIGGAASLIANNVVSVREVFMLDEFGVPEALWLIDIKDFSVVVTMDANGNSLHQEVKSNSDNKVKELFETI
jgi:fumarate hydratase class I